MHCICTVGAFVNLKEIITLERGVYIYFVIAENILVNQMYIL